ncbi:sialate O-acetylesterase [Parasphingopyxis marina]|uniref:Sialate O-acetylesterase domain-containing protein n=1 Tax=Parasphingopyxis marina TaxID=2761622 RepID=A0A842I0N9_9SPHN|nr:sialate O-acetylesterase [Parasphingopyxis marina]MBC2777740.1 hypothetical protein [Parasphingopyxis marina]
MKADRTSRGIPGRFRHLVHSLVPFLERKPPRGGANFLLAGQSNIAEWVTADGGAALESFRRKFLALSPASSSVQFFSVARGGTALLHDFARANAESDPGDDAIKARIRQNYWCEGESKSFGPAFALAQRKIGAWRAQSTRFDEIIWAQGESDAINLREADFDRYCAALSDVLLALREKANCERVLVQELGHWTCTGTRGKCGIERVRRAQREVAAACPAIEIASASFDLPTRDGIHLTTEGYCIAADRMAVAIATGERSPLPVSGSSDAQGRIEIGLDMVPGQRLDANDRTTGWRLVDEIGEIAIAELSTHAEGRIVLSAERPFEKALLSYAGAACVENMVDGDFLTVTGANLTLPVRPFSFATGGG